jgi:hypothetical protein
LQGSGRSILVFPRDYIDRVAATWSILQKIVTAREFGVFISVFDIDISNSQEYFDASTNVGFVIEHEPQHAARARKSLQTVEWLPAIR